MKHAVMTSVQRLCLLTWLKGNKKAKAITFLVDSASFCPPMIVIQMVHNYFNKGQQLLLSLAFLWNEL